MSATSHFLLISSSTMSLAMHLSFKMLLDHLSLAFFTLSALYILLSHLPIPCNHCSAMSATSHFLLISSFHNVLYQLSFIYSNYASMPSLPYFPHILCNFYFFTTSDFLELEFVSLSSSKNIPRKFDGFYPMFTGLYF